MASNRSKAAGKTPSRPRTQVDPRTTSTPAAPPAAPPNTTATANTHVSPEGKAADDAKLPKRAKSALVSATVPASFNLTHDDGTRTTYEPGVQDMPRDHAEHWYAKANGVELNED